MSCRFVTRYSERECTCTKESGKALFGCLGDELRGFKGGLRGSCLLSHCFYLSALPPLLTVPGDLTLDGLYKLDALPRGLTVGGNLTLHFTAVHAIGPGLSVGGNLHLERCYNLYELPADLRVGGNITIVNCSSLGLRDGLKVKGSLKLEHSRIKSLPKGLVVGKHLMLNNAVELTDIAHPLTVGGSLQMRNCPKLASVAPLTVGGSVDFTGCTALTTLAPLTAGGHINLTGCTALTTLPDDLVAKKALCLADCTRLAHLPRRLTVCGHLDVSRSGLVALPYDLLLLEAAADLGKYTRATTEQQGLTLHTGLTITGCAAFTTLPARLEAQELGFEECNALVALPEALVLRGGLRVRKCKAFTHLPRALHIAGMLTVEDCASFVGVPADLRVEMSIWIKCCPRLTSFPAGVAVPHDLNLSGCTGLTQLPDDFEVGSDLCLDGCTALTQLPRGLVVHDSLSLMGCTGLTALPTGMRPAYRVNLTSCFNITSLPPDLASWPVKEDYPQDRTINITDTGIPARVRARLAAATIPHTRFVFDNEFTKNHRPRKPDPPPEEQALAVAMHTALLAVLAFWTPTPDDAAWLPGDDDKFQLAAFLSRLRASAAYQNTRTRQSVRTRVGELLGELRQSKALAALCCERIARVLGNTEASVLLGELEYAVREVGAEASRERLEAFGEGLMKLEVVHAHAARACERLRWVDDAEVARTFEAHLREPLSLPVPAPTEEHVAEVTACELDAAKAAALCAVADTDKRAAWFASWPPWERAERAAAAAALVHGALPEHAVEFASYLEPYCRLTRVPLRNLRAPIALGDPADARVYEAAPFLNHWRERGTEPAKGPVTLADLWRPRLQKQRKRWRME